MSILDDEPLTIIRPLDEMEMLAVVRAINYFDGHRTKTAAALGISVRSLTSKIKEYKRLGIAIPPPKSGVRKNGERTEAS